MTFSLRSPFGTECGGTHCSSSTMWQRLEGAKFEASPDFVAISYLKDKSEVVGLPRSYFNTEKAVLSNPQKRLEKLINASSNTMDNTGTEQKATKQVTEYAHDSTSRMFQTMKK